MKKKKYRIDASRKWYAGAKLCGPYSSAAQARERMLQRQRRDSEELPGGPQQTAATSASAAKVATVEELLQLFKMGS